MTPSPPAGSVPSQQELVESSQALHTQLSGIRAAMFSLEAESCGSLDAVAPVYRASARNLLHFIALHRQHHVGLADQLHRLGLSSLAGSDPHVLASVDAVLTALEALGGIAAPARPASMAPDLMASHCSLLFGAPASEPGIMVTLPTEAAHDRESDGLISELLTAGMTLARINCAHDEPAVWHALAGRVRRLSAELGRHCRIAMDLAGPKLRTGELPCLEGVLRVRPSRDRRGRLLQPALIRATDRPPDEAPGAAVVLLPVETADWQTFRPGDVLQGIDASGRRRALTVESADSRGLLLRAGQGCRFVAGLRFEGPRRTALVVAPLPPEPGSLTLVPGERLWLLGTAEPAAAGRGGETHAAIACSLPELIPLIRAGERVLFDDGRITARVCAEGTERLLLEVTAARGGRARLRGGKGINFPDSSLPTPALTAKDLEDLGSAVALADMVNISFVHTPADITALHRALQEHGREDLAVVLKIETRQAYEGLPQLLLEGMRWPAPLGLMIARGDLAVECGWESLARIQHDILRLCAAAHVPCIWATQVLDELARHGLPTRAEITDAAIGAQAHALMLNKGPNITAAVRALRSIAHDTLRASRSDRLLSCLAYRSNCPGG